MKEQLVKQLNNNTMKDIYKELIPLLKQDVTKGYESRIDHKNKRYSITLWDSTSSYICDNLNDYTIIDSKLELIRIDLINDKREFWF